MSIDRTDTAERLARIEQMIEECRWAEQRQLLQRASTFWRKAEAINSMTAAEGCLAHFCLPTIGGPTYASSLDMLMEFALALAVCLP